MQSNLSPSVASRPTAQPRHISDIMAAPYLAHQEAPVHSLCTLLLYIRESTSYSHMCELLTCSAASGSAENLHGADHLSVPPQWWVGTLVACW